MVSPSPPLPQTLCGRSFRALVSQKNFDAISEHSLFFQIKSMTSKNLICMPLIGSIYGIFMDDICTFAGGQVGIFINLAPWQSTCFLQVFILLAGFYTRWGRGIQQVCWLEISTSCLTLGKGRTGSHSCRDVTLINVWSRKWQDNVLDMLE